MSDPDDPRLAPYRCIRERDLAGRDGRFVIEGEVVLRLALSDRCRFAVESVLLAAPRVAALEPLLARRPDLPVYAVERNVMSAVAGFPMHRGVLAIGRRGPTPVADALMKELPEPSAVLVLIGLANHDNVGACFRNAAAFGAAAVLLDETSCDPLYRKAIRVS
ncbi:MAG: RNA methyltransferase, partial [Methylobacteriaceae bacterium]|nr:RNA methyltransferase [Methylobacteriaceae bacterium]